MSGSMSDDADGSSILINEISSIICLT